MKIRWSLLLLCMLLLLPACGQTSPVPSAAQTTPDSAAGSPPPSPEMPDPALCIENADEALRRNDGAAALDWLLQAESAGGDAAAIGARREYIRLFDNSYWIIGMGPTLGTTYHAVFHLDGSYLSSNVNLVPMDGSFRYADGVLTLDGEDYVGDAEGFVSVGNYPMMGFEAEGAKRTITPDPAAYYQEIVSSEDWIGRFGGA